MACARVLTGEQKTVLNATDVNGLINMDCRKVFGPDDIILQELRRQIISFAEEEQASPTFNDEWTVGPELSHEIYMYKNMGKSLRIY